MNFCVRSAPPRPATELRSVRRSLNTPVLAIAELPVGPGSAAIATFVEPRDGISRYTLAVRCERSREVVFFCAREEGLSVSDASLVGEAALSLAEGMGFLFEEDSVPISGEAAASIWRAFAESADPSVAATAAPPTPLLTKFRCPPSWATLGPAAAAVGVPNTEPQRAARGIDAGLALSDTQVARRGGR